ESAESHPKMRAGFVGTSLHVRKHTKVLLHHPRQPAVAKTMRESRGFPVPLFRGRHITLQLRHGPKAVDRIRPPALVPDGIRNSEALLIQLFGRGMDTALTQD